MVALHQITEMLDSIPEYRFIQNGFVQSQLQAGQFLDAPRSVSFSPSGKTTTLQKPGSQPIETPMTRIRCIGYPLSHIRVRGGPMRRERFRGFAMGD